MASIYPLKRSQWESLEHSIYLYQMALDQAGQCTFIPIAFQSTVSSVAGPGGTFWRDSRYYSQHRVFLKAAQTFDFSPKYLQVCYNGIFMSAVQASGLSLVDPQEILPYLALLKYLHFCENMKLDRILTNPHPVFPSKDR